MPVSSISDVFELAEEMHAAGMQVLISDKLAELNLLLPNDPAIQKIFRDALWEKAIHNPDLILATKIGKILASFTSLDPRLSLLLAYVNHQNNDFDECARLFGQIGKFPKAEFTLYEPYLTDCIAFVLANYTKIYADAMGVARHAEMKSRINAVFVSIISLYLSCSPHATAVHFKIWVAAFVNRLQIPGHDDVVAEALQTIASTRDPEFFSQSFAYFASVGNYEVAEAMAEAGLADEVVSQNPHFLKTLCDLSRMVGKPHYETWALRRAMASDLRKMSWTFYLAEAQILELEARACHTDLRRFSLEFLPTALVQRERIQVGLPPWLHDELPRARGTVAQQPPRIFVGLFGQLRDPHIMIPYIFKYFQTDLAQNFDNFRCRFAVSTWLQKDITDSHIGVFLAALPGKIAEIIVNEGVQSNRHLADLLPQTYQFILQASGMAALDAQGQREELTHQLGGDAVINLQSEDEIGHFLQEVEARDPFVGTGQLRNQFKMWHRIGGLETALEAAEEAEGHPYDVVIIMRVDLRIQAGSLAKLANMAGHIKDDRLVFCDYDRQVLFVDGLGDRFFVASREGIRPLLGGFRKLERIFSATSDAPISFRHRIGGHKFVKSVLFTSGSEVVQVPKNQVEWTIHRTSHSMQALDHALRQDAATCQSPRIKERLTKILGPFGR